MAFSSAFMAAKLSAVSSTPLVARELGERDAEVGRAAGIVGVIVVAALHLQHVGEGALEDARRLAGSRVGATRRPG